MDAYRYGVLLLVVSAVPAQAEAQRKNEIFVGRYDARVEYEDRSLAEERAKGFQVGYFRRFGEIFGVKASYFLLDNEVSSKFDVSGYDVSLLYGALGQGFNMFGGLGYFSETREGGYWGGDGNFSGLQFVVGAGYKWERIGLDFTFKSRDPSDYERAVNASSNIDTQASAYSGSLNIGYRF